VAMSVVLLEEFSNLWSPYGVALLAKVAGFGLLMGLATLNKWRLGPAIAAGNAASLATFRRSVVAEWCLIAGVLTITATMTLLFSPTHH
jgi:putative copper resistance protein D